MQTSLDLLRKRADKTLQLPVPARRIVEGYLHITVDGAQAPCPYHINSGVQANRALLGKGTPHEIETLAAKWFEKYNMRTAGDTATLRAFLAACGIGIDCSGFAAWVLNAITETTLRRPLWQCLRFPGIKRTLVSKVRPMQNISANLLTGHVNAQPVTDLTHIRPGDLLRVAGWHHVVVITEVGLGKNSQAQYFQYAQSSCMYGQDSGVRTGFAIIQNPTGHLLEQQWFDNYERSVIKELIAEGGEDSRAVRLKALA